ncbi:hypothetical protein [Rufibacter psychrotolerans]|uniref:hypothetical protein n=1 Tax=Rufibacter psychrotolerans TaxID=2812556 RepID=UPI001967B698|nr:hypothetical protein [Rufibacter sp. SYSU D00308]
MNNRFYSLKCFCLAVLAGFTFVSCSDDDEEEVSPNTDNKVVYNGTTYSMKSGLVEDYGPSDNHYNYDFYITDGTITTSNNDFEVVNSKIVLFAELLSPGTSEFKTGTFSFVQNYNDAGNENKHVFEDALVVTDTNNDNILDEQDEELGVTGGTVKVSGGNNRNYTVEFDVTLENGKTAKGGYSGTFTYRDERD